MTDEYKKRKKSYIIYEGGVYSCILCEAKQVAQLSQRDRCKVG